MKRSMCCGSVAVVVLLVIGPSWATADEWVSMFNGKTLAGWTQKNGTATYVVKDGTILGTTSDGSPNSFLCSVKEYGDFELEFEVKVDSQLNSGVQIRSQTKDEDGNVYTGQWLDNQKHGKGVMIWENGDKYEGQWRDGKISGRGKCWYRNGNIYEGEWEDGQRHGKGINSGKDGDRYEG